MNSPLPHPLPTHSVRHRTGDSRKETPRVFGVVSFRTKTSRKWNDFRSLTFHTEKVPWSPGLYPPMVRPGPQSASEASRYSCILRYRQYWFKSNCAEASFRHSVHQIQKKPRKITTCVQVTSQRKWFLELNFVRMFTFISDSVNRHNKAQINLDGPFTHQNVMSLERQLADCTGLGGNGSCDSMVPPSCALSGGVINCCISKTPERHSQATRSSKMQILRSSK